MAVVVTLELALLAVAALLFVRSSPETTFPATIAAASPGASAPAAPTSFVVPVSVSIGVSGATETVELRPRGGRAAATPTAAADRGYVGYRRSAGRSAERP